MTKVLKNPQRKVWTIKEVNTLINQWSRMRTKELAEMMGRSYYALAKKAHKLRLKKSDDMIKSGF